jgi:hypothetical protein
VGEATRIAADGLLEGYDTETGTVLWREKKKDVDPTKPMRRGGKRGRPAFTDTHHTVIDGNGRKIRVPKGTNPDYLPHTVWPYSKVTCDNICMEISEGATLSEVSLMEGFPSRKVIFNWLREYPEFRQAMKIARELRAEHFHDKIVGVAKNAKEKTAKRDRLQLDAYKWVAGVNDPGTFGNQTKIVGDANAPLKLIVETGVRLAGDPGSDPNPGASGTSLPPPPEAPGELEGSE